jgi:hypothetical protein
MAALWVVYWICVQVWFEDTPIVDPKPIELDSPESPVSEPVYIMTKAQWGVVATMCWQAMSSFFILGAWVSTVALRDPDPVNKQPGSEHSRFYVVKRPCQSVPLLPLSGW